MATFRSTLSLMRVIGDIDLVLKLPLFSVSKDDWSSTAYAVSKSTSKISADMHRHTHGRSSEMMQVTPKCPELCETLRIF